MAILVFFMITVTALNSSMDEKALVETFGSISYDITVNYVGGEERKEQVEQEIETTTNITTKYKMEQRFITLDGEQYSGLIVSDPKLFQCILKGREPLYDNELVITEIVSEEIGKTVGDTVTVTYQEGTYDYMISGIFQNTENVGKPFGISIEAIKKMYPEFITNSIEYQIEDSENSAEFTKILNGRYGDYIKAKDGNSDDTFDVIVVTTHMIAYIIYVVSILFILVVVFMVCSKMFLKEQQDFGIYKAFGFTSANLRLQFSIRFLVVAIVGSVFGIIANVFLSDRMMSSLLRSMGVTNYVTNYSIPTILIPAGLITLCFFLFAYFVSGKIKRVDTKSLIVE